MARLLGVMVLLCGLVVGTAAAPARAEEIWAAWRNALSPAGAPGPELTLAVDGKTEYLIVTSAEATTHQKAAADLAHWLEAMTGASFPVVADSEPVRPHEISVGRTNRLREAALSIANADLGEDGYAVAVKDQRLFLLGGAKRGPINAVYALLEEDLGCRWYAGDGSTIPSRPTLRFRPVPRSYVPALRIRDPFYKVAFDGTWSLRNRTNAPSASVPEEWGGNFDYALFVHTFHALVPPGEHFDAHPEYFMLDSEGKRNPHQLCTTHPDAIRIATESVRRILKEHPHAEFISVSKTDGGRTCLCENCKALDDAEGTNAASLLHLVNAVAEAVEEDFPSVVVSTLAYLETVKPPATMRPRDNVAIRLCTDNCMWSHPFTPAEKTAAFKDAMTGWATVHDRIHVWDYCVNFSHYTAPMPNMDVIAKNIRFFVANNATGVMEQGAYQSPGAERDLMRAWVIGKLLWDPSRDVWPLMKDFIWGYFEEAAPAILEYNRLLRRVAEQHADTLRSPTGGIRYPMDSPFLSAEFLGKATELYDRAERLAQKPATLQRVEGDRLPIMYVKLCRGPEFVGDEYAALIDRFESIARREGLTHIYEGPQDLEKKLEGWRKALEGPAQGEGSP